MWCMRSSGKGVRFTGLVDRFLCDGGVAMGAMSVRKWLAGWWYSDCWRFDRPRKALQGGMCLACGR